MKRRGILNGMSMVIVVMAALLLFFGCGGGGDDDNGNGGAAATYDWNFTIQLVNSADGTIVGLTLNDITINTDSGTIYGLAYAGVNLTFRVDNITIEPCIITVNINVPGYVPVTRQFRATINTLTDESDVGVDFKITLLTDAEIPTGTDVGNSNGVAADAGTGTGEQLTLLAPVDAGNGTTGTANIAAGTVMGNQNGGVTGTLTMTMLLHDGNDANSRQFFASGTYTGIVVNPTGYTGFLPDGSDFYTGDATTALFASLYIRDGSGNLVTYASAYPTATFTLNNGQLDGNGNPIQVGDTIPFFVYDHINGLWIFVENVTVTAGAGGALQVQVTWQFPAGSGLSRADWHLLPHSGGFFFLSNFSGEDQVPPTVTGGN